MFILSCLKDGNDFEEMAEIYFFNQIFITINKTYVIVQC